MFKLPDVSFYHRAGLIMIECSSNTFTAFIGFKCSIEQGRPTREGSKAPRSYLFSYLKPVVPHSLSELKKFEQIQISCRSSRVGSCLKPPNFEMGARHGCSFAKKSFRVGLLPKLLPRFEAEIDLGFFLSCFAKHFLGSGQK